MSREYKKGQLKLEGANPMAFIEIDDEPTEGWTPDQDAAATTISQAIKSYLKAAENLACCKYNHLRDKIPEYMISPGNVLIAICTDGIVIRYEKKAHNEYKLVVTVIQQGIAEIAALLSQNLVYIKSSEAPHPLDKNFGVEFKLSVHSSSNGTIHDLTSSRIWFQVEASSPKPVSPPGAKPYCLLSVRNQLDLEIHGQLVAEGDASAPNQPFIARSTIRLIAGWECIEVFPSPGSILMSGT